jgi:hypothetical protein
MSNPVQPPDSALAGIVDRKGGLRVVVTEEWRMPFHVNRGERAFILPGIKVREPVPWEQIAWTIRRVELYIALWIRTRNWIDHAGVRRYRERCERAEAGFYNGPSTGVMIEGRIIDGPP